MLEDRIEKLESQLRIVRRKSQAQQSPYATNVICYSRDRDRLTAAFMIAIQRVQRATELGGF